MFSSKDACGATAEIQWVNLLPTVSYPIKTLVWVLTALLLN